MEKHQIEPLGARSRGDWLAARFGGSVRRHSVHQEVMTMDQEVMSARPATDAVDETPPLRTVPSVPRAAQGWQWTVSPDIMFVARFDGVLLAANPAWNTVLGWTEHELIGRTLFDLVHPDDQAQARDAARGLARGKPCARIESQYRHKDGSYRWIGWAAVSGENAINAIGRDVTLEKRQAEALHQAEVALRQSLKMEAIGQLTGGLAHDFNNMLAVVTGNLELLRVRLCQGQTTDLAQYIATAQGASKRAAALASRLLAFSRQQTLNPRASDVNRLAGGMVEFIHRTMGPGITVEMVMARDVWTTWIDPNQFENALLNLCNNARDAMSQGGQLTIETLNVCLDPDTALAYDLPAGEYVALYVSDTGCGMAPEVITQAFAAFFTTKQNGLGTGLGLSMIHDFVSRSGGRARIESQPGDGTTVCLYLPRHLGEAEPLMTPELPADLARAPHAGRGETVLVVDDEPTMRDLVTEVLEELGYNAIAAADGAAGLQVLLSNVAIDLLVADIGLPGGMDGQQMAEAGRALRPGLKVLFITGYAECEAISPSRLDPTICVLTKPFAMETLARRIKDLIAQA